MLDGEIAAVGGVLDVVGSHSGEREPAWRTRAGREENDLGGIPRNGDGPLAVGRQAVRLPVTETHRRRAIAAAKVDATGGVRASVQDFGEENGGAVVGYRTHLGSVEPTDLSIRGFSRRPASHADRKS